MVFMMFKTNVFKEAILPNVDNTDYRILIDRKQFEITRSFYLKFEVINQKWRIKSDKKAYELFCKCSLDYIDINCGDIITIKTVDGDIIKGITFDNEMSLLPFKKFDILHSDRINIGKAEDNNIRYEFMNLVSMNHCSIERTSSKHILCDYSRNGVFVNHRRIVKRYTLHFGDIIEIFGLRIIYLKDILAVGTRVGSFVVDDSLIKYIVNNNDDHIINMKHSEKYFNRSPRIFPRICSEQIVIEPPTSPQFSKKKSLIMIIGPSFTMAIPMLLGCGLMILGSMMSAGTMSAFMFTGMITALGSAIMGALWALINVRNTRKEEFEEETKRFNAYGNYLLEISEYIKDKYRQNTDALYKLYPSPVECCEYNSSSPQLWNRNPSHNDFLFYRLGTGDIDFQMDIQISKERFTVQSDNLKDKPSIIYNNFKVLKNVPVGIDFSEKNIYGIVGGEKKRGAYDIVNNIIAQIAVSSSYVDIKIAFCYDKRKADDSKWDYIKWLPHVWSENRNIRYFASNRQEAADVFFELSNIIRQRAEENTDSFHKKTFRPHYFLFITDINMLDGEIISKYVFDNKNKIGLTTFIISDYYQNLPNICETIIENDDNFCGYYDAVGSMHKSVQIKFDKVPQYALNSFAKRIANITVKEIEDNSSLVSSLNFFEMYGIYRPEDLNIAELWRKNRTYHSMRALIGKKVGGTGCYLDIHEKFHGPHGLVAGTTGSGKSELLQTYIISLALNYSPDDVAFFIIDFKGGGMANLFSGLPHMSGQISNLSGNQINRAMISIKSENMRRQRIFSDFGVNNINNYTRLFKSGEAPLPIPHLLIVIDEFAELKKEEPEFMRELISVAQVGRSLGVHLILATQKPSGTVDDNIWSNSKFRLCLRVQDRQDSNDMLHKPDAAYITQAGRGYLQVGNDEIYEMFQSGWSGAVYDRNYDKNSGEVATMITTTGREALVGSHFKIKRREKERFEWLEFLLEEVIRLKSKIEDKEKIALELIKAARNNNYNVGNRNTDVQALCNFIELIPDNIVSVNDAIHHIISKSSALNLKLPELKEKTQLEVLIEYIAAVANKEQYNHKAQLWMPLLKNEIALNDICDSIKLFNGCEWVAHEYFTLSVSVGIYDDPHNQVQLPFVVDFEKGGHLAVFGSVVSGKSTFMQTLIFALAMKYSPEEMNFYILDFGGGILSCFEVLPHSGGIIKENETDKTGKFFNMIFTIIEERKKMFNGGNYSQYVKANGLCIPSVVIVIDNFAGFREKTDNIYEDIIIRLSREGASYGIYLAVTAAGFGISEIPNRIGDNMKNVVCLEMSDKFKYMDALRVTNIDVLPETGVKGRGLGYVEGRILEFQTGLSFIAEDDYKRKSMIEKVCEKMSSAYKGKRVRQIPCIPENPLYSDISILDEYLSACKEGTKLPVAYRAEDASVFSVDLISTYCYVITGKKRTGKTNALKLFMLASVFKQAKRVVIEKNTNELKNIIPKEKFDYVTDDIGILNYFQNITNDFVERNKKKKELEANGLNDEEIFFGMQSYEPFFVFIADLYDFINTIYHPDNNIGNLNSFFENIFEKGFLHNIYFFACLNTDEAPALTGKKAYHTFVSYKTGMHLGGNISAQRIFSFSNIHYTQMSKSSKKGEALVPSVEDESVADKLIIPLVGGKGT